jgi:hypothetical protein
MAAHPPRIALDDAEPPYTLIDYLLPRLAIRNCIDGLRSHGRRCRCRSCAGWRRFLAAHLRGGARC